jgi:hypothetical protein
MVHAFWYKHSNVLADPSMIKGGGGGGERERGAYRASGILRQGTVRGEELSVVAVGAGWTLLEQPSL